MYPYFYLVLIKQYEKLLIAFLSKNIPARTKRGVLLNSSPLSFLMGWVSKIRRSALEADGNVQRSPCDLMAPKGNGMTRTSWTVLMHTGRFHFPRREHLWEQQETTPAQQSRASLPSSPLLSASFLPSPMLTVLSWILLLQPCVLPRASSQRLFLWDAVPSSLPVQTAFPWHPAWSGPLHRAVLGRMGDIL